ncbi:DUF4114 domain-containing protein [Spirulina sp. 06S082]|nr:DUF4114 domain-containing protein [Spirulina sp. 06S082]
MQMQKGDRFGIMLVPNGTVEQLAANPAPLFLRICELMAINRSNGRRDRP